MLLGFDVFLKKTATTDISTHGHTLSRNRRSSGLRRVGRRHSGNAPTSVDSNKLCRAGRTDLNGGRHCKRAGSGWHQVRSFGPLHRADGPGGIGRGPGTRANGRESHSPLLAGLSAVDGILSTMEQFLLQLELQDFQTRYTSTIDDGRISAWHDFFPPPPPKTTRAPGRER